MDQRAIVLLEALLLYEETATHFRFRQDVIEAFRPGEWLVELLSVADRVALEFDARLTAAEQDRAREQVRKFA